MFEPAYEEWRKRVLEEEGRTTLPLSTANLLLELYIQARTYEVIWGAYHSPHNKPKEHIVDLVVKRIQTFTIGPDILVQEWLLFSLPQKSTLVSTGGNRQTV